MAIRTSAAGALWLGLLVLGDARAQSVPASVYAQPGRLVAVEGRRRLNLRCMGSGAPTVILEAGLGDSSLTWASVQARMAQVTTVCAYDRAGYAFSDPAPRPSDASEISSDLQRLIKAARLKTPVVIVAHSLGGLYATLFAARHRAEVSGMVLIDPSFAEQNREIFEISTPAQRAASDARLRGFMDNGTRCLDLARQGRVSEATPECLPMVPDSALNRINRLQYAQPKTQAANLSEIVSISSFKDDKVSADSRAISQARPNFGAMPLIVLTRGNPTPPPPPPFFDAATQAKVDAAWKAGHDRLAALSTVGKLIVVPASDHYIQRDQPDAVISATLEVIEAVRASPAR